MKERQLKISIPVLLATAILTSGIAQAQTWSQLNALPGGMKGAPILVSNNPESVSRAGLLLGMDPMNSVDPAKVSRRLTGATLLDSSCPSGGMREFVLYMHHILGDPTGTDARVDRIFLILEPVGGEASYTTFGVAISQRDILESAALTLDPGRSPSYSVVNALTTGAMPSWVGSANGSKIISVPTDKPVTIKGPTEIFQLRSGTVPKGTSLDARITIKAATGCLRARLVAAPSTITTVTAANDLGKSLYAWGNVPTTYKLDGTTNVRGGTPCTARQSLIQGTTYNWTGWGRPAGIYGFSKWAGTVPVSFTATGQTFGYRYLAAPSNLLKEISSDPVTMPSGVCDPSPGAASSPSGDAQRPLALRYYSSNTSTYATGRPADRDSDKFSTANYGAEYNVTYNVANNSNICMKAQLVFTAYPGTQNCSTYTGEPLTRHYDGDFNIGVNGAKPFPKRAYVKCNISTAGVSQVAGPNADTSRGIPAAKVPETVLAEQVLGTSTTNRSVTWAVQNFVPGLISTPEAMLVRSVPAACP